MITPESIILKEYHGSTNFMTPRVEQYIEVIPGIRAAELSSGRGILDQPIFGISVVDYDLATNTTTRRVDLSGMFQSRSEAIAYAYSDTLKELEEISNE